MKIHTYRNSTSLFLDWESVCKHKEFETWNELRRFMGAAFDELQINDVVNHDEEL